MIFTRHDGFQMKMNLNILYLEEDTSIFKLLNNFTNLTFFSLIVRNLLC